MRDTVTVVTVTLACCQNHPNVQTLLAAGIRLTHNRCCKSWKHMRDFEVDCDTLREALKTFKKTKKAKPELPKFQLDDKVTWTSSAAGTTKVKTGTVVVVVPPGDDPVVAAREAGQLYWPRVELLRPT